MAERLRRVATGRTSRPLLVCANLVLLAAGGLHGIDHTFVQERGLGGLDLEPLLAGVAAVIAISVSLALALTDYPHAPAVALIVGFGNAAIVTVIHFLPSWSGFSDPYRDLPVGTFSWVVAFIVLGSALLLGAVGAYELRRQQAVPSVRPGESR